MVVKLWWFIRKKTVSRWTGAPTAVGVVRTEDGSVTVSVDGRGWSLLVSTLCTVLNSRTDKGVTVSLHLGSLPEAVFEASSCFKRCKAFIGGREKRNRWHRTLR